MSRGSFSSNYIDVRARHPVLGHDIQLYLPEKAEHRIAVREFLNGNYYEPFTHVAFNFILEKKGRRNVVHAGAFFGDMLHSLATSAGIVYAFEPVLENYLFAKKNTERLGLENVLLMNAGLAEINGLLPIKTSDRKGRFFGGGSTFSFGGRSEGQSFENVPVFRLDSLPLEDVVLIELDVEGFELPALRGGQSLIEKSRPVILLEDNSGNCSEFLTSLDYKLCFKTKGIHYWATGSDIEMLTGLQRLASDLDFLET